MSYTVEELAFLANRSLWSFKRDFDDVHVMSFLGKLNYTCPSVVEINEAELIKLLNDLTREDILE